MSDSRGSVMKTLKPRFGLLAKIILFLAAVLIPLAAVTWLISVQTLRQRMTEEFTSKGTAIANSLASSGVDLILTRDASTVQALIDQFATINGVAYVMVYDSNRAQIAHTFVPFVPPDVVDKNVVPGDLAKQVRDIDYADPVTGKSRRIIDIGVPMLGGTIGTVRVGHGPHDHRRRRGPLRLVPVRGVRRHRPAGGSGRRVLRPPPHPTHRADRAGGRARGPGRPQRDDQGAIGRRDRTAGPHLQRHRRAAALAGHDRDRARRGKAQARGAAAQHPALPRHRDGDRPGRPVPARRGHSGRARQRRRLHQRDGRGDRRACWATSVTPPSACRAAPAR